MSLGISFVHCVSGVARGRRWGRSAPGGRHPSYATALRCHTYLLQYLIFLSAYYFAFLLYSTTSKYLCTFSLYVSTITSVSPILSHSICQSYSFYLPSLLILSAILTHSISTLMHSICHCLSFRLPRLLILSAILTHTICHPYSYYMPS